MHHHASMKKSCMYLMDNFNQQKLHMHVAAPDLCNTWWAFSHLRNLSTNQLQLLYRINGDLSPEPILEGGESVPAICTCRSVHAYAYIYISFRNHACQKVPKSACMVLKALGWSRFPVLAGIFFPGTGGGGGHQGAGITTGFGGGAGGCFTFHFGVGDAKKGFATTGLNLGACGTADLCVWLGWLAAGVSAGLHATGDTGLAGDGSLSSLSSW